ncbi:MAG: EutN/CcmL family microcompartment protein [Planctomycetota bacterium]
MLLAKVVGTVVSTQKEPSMDGLRFMLLQPLDPEGQPAGAHVVAVDAVGSGTGEVVLYATGSSARQTVVTDKRPCDAVIMAIVDQWEVDGAVKYRKNEGQPTDKLPAY